jgi:multidrug resistance efflux pump
MSKLDEVRSEVRLKLAEALATIATLNENAIKLRATLEGLDIAEKCAEIDADAALTKELTEE